MRKGSASGAAPTRITESRRNRPKDYGGPQPPQGPIGEQIAELVRNGMAPADVAALVRKAVQANELYIREQTLS